MITALRMFLMNIQGIFAVLSAILLVPILGMAGSAVDFTTIYLEKPGLQQVADSAALAGVSELGIAGKTDSEVHSSVNSFVSSNIAASNGGVPYTKALNIEAEISDDRTTLTVKLSYNWSPFFAHLIYDMRCQSRSVPRQG